MMVPVQAFFEDILTTSYNQMIYIICSIYCYVGCGLFHFAELLCSGNLISDRRFMRDFG